LLAFSPGSEALQRYDKYHLVPFGEFVPLGFRWFIDLLQIPLGDFNRGSTDPVPMSLAGQRVAFNICYEDLFGNEIDRGAAVAGLLINVSNVAWFGDSMALPQHLEIARMRAIETARPMLRATNTGVTAAIDSRGLVLGSLAPYTTGALEVTIQATTGLTPYVRFGNPLVWAVAVLLLVLPALGSRRRIASRR
jgi:apolipoprotein N-acyltransferase